MTPSPTSNGDIQADTPGSVIRYPGFGVCPQCGHDVDYFTHFQMGGRDVTQIEHHGRFCTIVRKGY